MTRTELERACAQLRLQSEISIASIVVELVGIDRQPTDEELARAKALYRERAMAYLAQRDAAARSAVN